MGGRTGGQAGGHPALVPGAHRHLLHVQRARGGLPEVAIGPAGVHGSGAIRHGAVPVDGAGSRLSRGGCTVYA